MSINDSQQLKFGTELSATMTGSAVLIGTLPVQVAKIIFDNQGTVATAIYVNGTAPANLWHTFPAGEAITVDCNDDFAKGPLPIGTTFYGLGVSGTFSISYLFFKTG
jgi:hypothetical protein